MARAKLEENPVPFSRRSGLPKLQALALILTLAAPALALDPKRQLNQCRLRVWNTGDGLPQNAITALLQTHDGYLWIGTQGGLARFDGSSFTVFDHSNEPAFSDQFVTALASDAAGTLWVGTRQGLVRRKDGRFEKLTERDGLPADYVRSLLVDRRGLLWVGTYGGGLARLEDGVFRPVPLLDDESEILVRVLFIDSKGRLWVGTSRGLLRIEGSQRTLFTRKDGLHSLIIRAVSEDQTGRIWVGTEGGGLHVEQDGRFERWKEGELGPVRTVRALFADRHGSLWIGTQRQGLFRFESDQLSHLDTEAGMPHNFIWSILEDSEGSLWLGTRVGLVQLREGRITTFTRREGLVDESIRSILQSKDGSLWVGTEGGGLQLFRDGRFVSPSGDGLAARAQIRSLFEDKDGNLLLGTRSGIIRLGPDGRRNYSTREGLPNNVVNAFEEDRLGNLWIGTAGGVKLMKGERFETPAGLTGLTNVQVRALLRDRRGRMWIAAESGLSCVKEDGAVIRYTSRRGLHNEFVLSLHEDQSGLLWVGTAGGLFLMQDGRFVNFGLFPIEDNPFDDAIFRILEDDGDGLWMGTPKGILLARRSDLLEMAEGRRAEIRWERFNESDGLISSECNGGSQPAGWKTAEGHLWFPTVRGIAMIDPERIHRRRPPPMPIIQSVRIDNRQVPLAQPVWVAPDSASLEIRYGAPSFVTPERTRFRYRLEGFREDWFDAEERRAAFFTNLSPGDYRFEVSASLGEGEWSTTAVLGLYVEAAFHQTTVFRVAAALGVAALLGALFRLRVRTLEKRRHRLREIVEERTTQLQQANQSLRELASVDDLTQLANHRRFRESLNSEWRRAARAQHKLSLIVIDIDFFKKFNDEYGHLAGDRCLQQVAAALGKLFRREGELLARYGGEEFVAILPGVSMAEASRLAERIRALIQELGIEHRASPIAPVITVSAGVATASPQPRQDPEHLFEAADKAMYEAKRRGRNRVALA